METRETAAAAASLSGTWSLARGAISSFSVSPCVPCIVGQRADIIIGEFAIQDETVQRIALPGRAVLGPFEYLLKDCHNRLAGSASTCRFSVLIGTRIGRLSHRASNMPRENVLDIAGVERDIPRPLPETAVLVHGVHPLGEELPLCLILLRVLSLRLQDEVPRT